MSFSHEDKRHDFLERNLSISPFIITNYRISCVASLVVVILRFTCIPFLVNLVVIQYFTLILFHYTLAVFIPLEQLADTFFALIFLSFSKRTVHVLDSTQTSVSSKLLSFKFTWLLLMLLNKCNNSATIVLRVYMVTLIAVKQVSWHLICLSKQYLQEQS